MKSLFPRILILFLLFPSCSTKQYSTYDDASYVSVMTSIYQDNFSSVSFVRKGECPMYPSCSQFAKNAYQKHGFLLGSILATDRLMRCGRDETKRLKIVNINGKLLFYDPVPTHKSIKMNK